MSVTDRQTELTYAALFTSWQDQRPIFITYLCPLKLHDRHWLSSLTLLLARAAATSQNKTRIRQWRISLMWNSLTTLKCRQDHWQSIIWKLSCDYLLATSVSVDVPYIISEITGHIGMTTGWNDLQMSLKVIERGANELLLVVYRPSNFRRITHRFRDTSMF